MPRAPSVAIANVRASSSAAPNGSVGNRERQLSADRIRQPIRTLAPAALPAKAVCQVLSRRTYVRADRLDGQRSSTRVGVTHRTDRACRDRPKFTGMAAAAFAATAGTACTPMETCHQFTAR
jgi:hypothetical protein